MWYFSVQGRCVTASFRVPETHTFHQTLPLPSRTMMIGLLGAALGLPLPQAHDFAKDHGVLVSVSGSHQGFMKDLWNYRKVTTKEFAAEELKGRPHYSVLTREYLVYPSFTFIYASEDVSALRNMAAAFRNPAYALSAGNSDDLLKVTKVSEVAEVSFAPLQQFENTVLPGNLVSQCKYDIKAALQNKPVTFSFRMPEVFTLPTSFSFSGELRTGIDPQPFTFVRDAVTLTEPLEGCTVNGKNYVLY